MELAGACLRADQSVRKRIELENGVSSNEEAIDSLDKQLSESKATLSDSENKFDDISRKLATMESDASRGNTMAEGAEKKIKDIEEELRVVGANMQQLEIGEEKTMAREESSQVWLGLRGFDKKCVFFKTCQIPGRDSRADLQAEEKRVQGRAGGDEHPEVERQDRPGGGGPLGGEVQD